MAWSKLRQGLLTDLGFDSPEGLAQSIGYTDVTHLREALARKVAPNDELMSSMLRTYPVLPPMYFVESHLKIAG